jgi:hypothetical protein
VCRALNSQDRRFLARVVAKPVLTVSFDAPGTNMRVLPIDIDQATQP